MARPSNSHADDVTRQEKVAQLDAYLAEMERRLGPIPEVALAEAERWADRILGPERPING